MHCIAQRHITEVMWRWAEPFPIATSFAQVGVLSHISRNAEALEPKRANFKLP